MRISVCNWRTSAEDVERAVRAAEAVFRQEGRHGLRVHGNFPAHAFVVQA